MSIRRMSKKGFTLVEILIVVIILGILAAIVIPQFTNASQDARKSSLTSQLQTLRSQIELYKLQHKDNLPNILTAGGTWDYLTKKTDEDGTVDDGGAGPFPFGPYLQAPPSNPLNGLTNVVDGDGTAAAGGECGFIYDYSAGVGTGKVWGTDGDKTAIFVE